jgi:hypothetical protein
MVAYALSPLAVFFCKLGNLEVAAVSFIAIVVLFAHQKNIREEFARLCTERAQKEDSVQTNKESGS